MNSSFAYVLWRTFSRPIEGKYSEIWDSNNYANAVIFIELSRKDVIVSSWFKFFPLSPNAYLWQRLN